MGNEQQDDSFNEAQGLPAVLAAFDPVLLDKSEGVLENMNGIFKTDTVLVFVAYRLGFVPLELENTYNSIASYL
jgi:hypothetical protein